MGKKLEEAKLLLFSDLDGLGFPATTMYGWGDQKEYQYTKKYEDTGLIVEIVISNMARVKTYMPGTNSTPAILYHQVSVYKTTAQDLTACFESMCRAVESFEKVASEYEYS
jgi:hypothetical protein